MPGSMLANVECSVCFKSAVFLISAAETPEAAHCVLVACAGD